MVIKTCLLTTLISLTAALSFAQKKYPDTIQLQYINLPDPVAMEKLLPSKKDDTSKVNFLSRMALAFSWVQANKAVTYSQQGIQLAGKLGYRQGIADCSMSLGWGLWGAGNYTAALQAAYNCLHLNEDLNDEAAIAFSYILLANVYRDFGDYNRALTNARKGSALFHELNVYDMIGNANIGAIFDLQNRLDSASVYISKSLEIDKKINKGRWGWLYYLKGNIYRKLKQYDSAMYYYRTALPLVDYKDIVETYNGIALLYAETGKTDSAIYYASEVIQKWSTVSYQRGIQQAATILAAAYKKINTKDSLIKYLELSADLNNKLFNQEKERDIQNMSFNEQMRQDEIARERQQYYNKLKMFGLITLGLVFLIIALLLWRNNKHKQKANLLLLHQKQKVESTLLKLKSTQSQLIQSEKMASLGELTAGIAHEIQNPLNFVNNFSEVNIELTNDMNDENDIDEIKTLANDIKQNSEKILFHGKRADAIVKSMLQHSKQTKGIKEPIDINALCDEYLRLSYHGMRAKDKNFNAEIKTDFDETIGKINIVPQDIGRVLLNLFNNAFYAVSKPPSPKGEQYKPLVTVTTRKIKLSANDAAKSLPLGTGGLEIIVSDNGNGIPQNIIDKIFQPFFTTKPTGQGTGLGLSLSYDIIKAHGGEIKVDSKENDVTTFIIQLAAKEL